VLTDCDDQSYYVIKWMACLFDICNKKKTSSLRHALVQAQQEKNSKQKNPRAKKENLMKTSVSGAGAVILPNTFLQLHNESPAPR